VTLLQPTEEGLDPFLCRNGAFPVDLMSQSPEVLLDMMEIDSLTSILESVGGDVPNPECAVAQDQDELGHGQTPLKGLGVELSLKAIHAPSCGDVAALGDDRAAGGGGCALIQAEDRGGVDPVPSTGVLARFSQSLGFAPVVALANIPSIDFDD